jgi:hypothetical protein
VVVWHTMQYRSHGNGWQTFFEHLGFLLTVLIIVAVTQVLMFFFNLNGELWISFFVTDRVLLISGAALILYAKTPVYRNGRFFTLSFKSAPQSLMGFYRCGWLAYSFGVVLSLCLLFSKQ